MDITNEILLFLGVGYAAGFGTVCVVSYYWYGPRGEIRPSVILSILTHYNDELLIFLAH